MAETVKTLVYGMWCSMGWG